MLEMDLEDTIKDKKPLSYLIYIYIDIDIDN